MTILLPPHTKMLNSVKYRGLEFPDCGETSLRNLINALIYDNDHGTFNIEKLKKLGAVPLSLTIIANTNRLRHFR